MKTKTKDKSIVKLKKRSAKVAAQLQQAIKPLNQRLKKNNMLVWWDGDEYMINTASASKKTGHVFRLDDHCLNQLMAMSDQKLISFLKGF